MSKLIKLIQRLLTKPKDFTYDELVRLLNHFEYDEIPKGKTGGSHRAFIHDKTKHIIRLHKPHPSNILKSYVVDYVLEELKKQGQI